MVLSELQRLDWLQLIRCENIGPRSFHKLMLRYGSAAEALDALPALIRQGVGRKIVIASREAAARELAAAKNSARAMWRWARPIIPKASSISRRRRR